MAEIAIRITGKDDTGGAFRSAEDKARALNSATNRLAAAQFEASEAARKLMNAQAALARASDPTEQRKLTGEVLKLRVAADSAGGAVDKLQREINEMGAAADTADDKLKGASTATTGLAQAGNLLGQLGLGVSLAGIAAGAVAVGSEMIRLGMAAEQTEIAFTTLIGSTEGAQQHLEDLRAFAATTPFEFNDLTEASRKLQAFGFEAENVIPMMTDIGDAVAAMGGNAAMIDRVTLALGQMSAKGKIQAGEMLQLTEAGIPAWRYLAEAMGMSTAEVMKLSEKGLIPADKAIQDILKGMRQDFGGMMAEQSRTAAGGVSNLNDALARFATVIGKQANPAIYEFSVALSGVINSNAEMMEGQVGLQEAIAAGIVTQDEYNEIIRDTGHPAKALAEAMKLVAEREAEVDRETRRLADATPAAAEAMGELAEATDNAGGAGMRLEEASLKLPGALLAAEEQLKRNAEAVKGLSYLMGGAVGNELEQYRAKQTELRDKAAELGEKIEALKSKKYLTEDQKTELADLQTQLGETNTALDENAKAHEEAMRRIVFSMLQAQLATDGFTTEEVTALTTIAEKWGLIDPATKAATDAISQALDDTQKDGSWDMLDERIDTLSKNLLNIPTDIKVNINVHTGYTSSGAPSAAAGDLGLPGGDSAPVVVTPGEDVVLDGQRAHGGPVVAGGAYMVGERGPELFIPNTSGDILPNGAGGFGEANISITIYPQPGQSESAIAQEVRRQLDEYARRGDTRARL